MTTTQLVLIAYAVIVNIVGFASMGIDKKKARNHKWRVPETMLFFYAIIGGSLGSLIGMHLFHHKTKHWYFVIGIPLILVIQLVIIGLFIFNPNFKITFM